MGRRDVATNTGNGNRQITDIGATAERVTPDDPRVVSFLNDYTSMQRHRDQLLGIVEHRDLEIARLNDRVSLLQHDLTRTQTARDEFQKGYFELKAQLAILTTSAISACDQVRVVAERALSSAKSAMLENGIVEDVNQDGSPKLTDVETEMASLAAVANATGVPEREQA